MLKLHVSSSSVGGEEPVVPYGPVVGVPQGIQAGPGEPSHESTEVLSLLHYALQVHTRQNQNFDMLLSECNER